MLHYYFEWDQEPFTFFKFGLLKDNVAKFHQQNLKEIYCQTYSGSLMYPPLQLQPVTNVAIEKKIHEIIFLKIAECLSINFGSMSTERR